MKDWIEARRKELEDQRAKYVANVNACDGALQMLVATEAELTRPDSDFAKYMEKALAKARKK